MKKANLGVVVALLALVSWPRQMLAADGRAMRELADRLGSVEGRVRQLETERAQHQRQMEKTSADLAQERANVVALRQQLQAASTTASETRSGLSKAEAAMSDLKVRSPGAPSTQWGARFGWQGFPFKQRNNGGFFYGVFVDHRLLAETDGVPFGDLDGEIMIAYGKSEVEDNVKVTTALLGPQKVQFRQHQVSVLAGGRYFLNLWKKDWGFRPYITGGPGIWVNVVNSPPLLVGQIPHPPEFSAKKLSVPGTAEAFGGGYVGAGWTYSLAGTDLPIVSRLQVGFDYRYNMFATGQRFSMYSFSIAAGL